MTPRRRWSRSLLLLSTMLLVGLALGPLSARPAAAVAQPEGPGLTLEPDHGRPGDEVLLRGTGFPADTAGEVRLTLDASPQADLATGRDGAFEVALAVPDLAPGTYEYVAAVASADGEVTAAVAFTVDEPLAPTETETPTAVPATPTTTPSETAAPTDTPTATPSDVSSATLVSAPAGPATPVGETPAVTATEEGEVGGAGAATLTLDKEKSKFNGFVNAVVTGLAPNSSATLRWPRAYPITNGPDAGETTTLLDTATTDGTGRATFGFRTPLEPTGDYTVTARDRSGGKATDTLRVIPRILLNEEVGSTSTRLRVYFYGFGPGERIETRWHAGGSITSGFQILKTLTVASNGRTSSIVEIPSNAATGAHLIVGKVIGVSRSASTPFRVTRSTESATVLAVGDIASCASTGDEQVAAVVAGQPGTLLIPGDIAYDSGTAQEFAECYDPAWGQFKDRTRPVPGNHEYVTPGASGYFDYFGAAAGDPSKGYYSYDLGAWHIVAINSNCTRVGGCGAGSAMERWLRTDLAANPADCTLAYMHHPRFSSGGHGNNANVQAIWQALYDADVDVLLAGHDHDYERFAPQDAEGDADAERGIRQFVVGTGGRSHDEFPTVEPNSEVREGDTFGVLRMELRPTGYAWDFLPVAGETFTDSGTGTCHTEDGLIGGAGDMAAVARRTGLASLDRTAVPVALNRRQQLVVE